VHQTDITWPWELDSVEDMRRFMRLVYPKLYALGEQLAGRAVPPEVPKYSELGPAAARMWSALNRAGAAPLPSVPAPPTSVPAPSAAAAARPYGADPSWYSEPAGHQQALDLMLSRPGMTYTAALDQVQRQAGIAPNQPVWPPLPKQPAWLAGVAAGLPIARPEGDWLQVDTPRFHEAAVSYMLAHPGMAYETALAHVEHPAAGPAPVPVAAPAAPTESGWMQAEAPQFHEQAVTHMLAHPGLSYEDAYTFVSGGH
jgi:hypothetical protein